MSNTVLDEPRTHAIRSPGCDAPLHEIIDGVQSDLPPMGAYSTFIVCELAYQLSRHVQRQQRGVVAAQLLFVFERNHSRGRRPDVAFVSRERCRQSPLPKTGDWDVVPDLAVEVISPNDDASDLEEKLVEYFHFGVRQVWVLHPEQRRLYVHESLRQVSVLNENDSISGGDLFPGLSLPLADLFAAVSLAE